MNTEKKEKINTSLAILPIGIVAQTLNVHQRTLRIWDSQGILCPKRTDKNRRSYSFDDIEKGKLILFLTRNLALNLAGVKITLGFFEELKIKPADYMEYIEKIAKQTGMDTKAQESNIEKTSKRGRRTKVSK